MTVHLPVAADWFEAEVVDDLTVRLREASVDPLLRSNIWLVRGRDRDLVIDTGNGIAPLRPVLAALQDETAKPLVGIATHAHGDHAGGLHEFDERIVHVSEVDRLAELGDRAILLAETWPQAFREETAAAGYPLPEVLLEGLPWPDFDAGGFFPRPCAPTRTVREGDHIDLGDRCMEVLELSGHSPGSIGLWEAATGTLFSGDAAYEGWDLLDDLPGGDPEAYRATVERLRDLPVTVVHAGHEGSFGRDQLVAICDAYLAGLGL